MIILGDCLEYIKSLNADSQVLMDQIIDQSYVEYTIHIICGLCIDRSVATKTDSEQNESSVSRLIDSVIDNSQLSTESRLKYLSLELSYHT
jgi:hypothetical protein